MARPSISVAVMPFPRRGQALIQQVLAQLWGDLVGRLGGQQVIHIGGGIADQFALLIDFELIQANVGDLVRQVTVDPKAWQGLFLFVENLGEQQAADQRDEFVQTGHD